MRKLFSALLVTGSIFGFNSVSAFAEDKINICLGVMPTNAFLSYDGNLYADARKVEPGQCFFESAAIMMNMACERLSEVTQPQGVLPEKCQNVVDGLVSFHEQEKSALISELAKLKKERRRLRNRVGALSRR
jgi:hypothetical protein